MSKWQFIKIPKILRRKDNIHTISMVVANKPGVLARISLIFSRRNFNIESLIVSPMGNGEKTSHITITAIGKQEMVEKVVKQLNRLIDILEITEHTGNKFLYRELAFIKIKAHGKKSQDEKLFNIIDNFKATPVEYNNYSVIVQFIGLTDEIDIFLKEVEDFGLLEIVRTGKISIEK